MRPLVLAGLFALVWGVWLGLLRLGWSLPLPWQDQLILHGPLMIGGFLGTLIGLERAVEFPKPWAYIVPLSTAAGALMLVFGPPGRSGALLIALASAASVVVSLSVMHGSRSFFALTPLAGVVAWTIGNVWWLTGAAVYSVVPWWMAFVVLTIAGERIELTAAFQPTALVRRAFAVASTMFLAGPVISLRWPLVGARVSGLGLVIMASWLVRNDVARREIAQRGQPRFTVVSLLLGYVWLGVAGVLLMVTAEMLPGTTYDAILHAVFVGFLLSILFGHAPIVGRTVLGVDVPYRAAFYLHLLILHAAVVVRLMGDLVESLGRLRAWGGLFNAVAVGVFLANAVGSVVWQIVTRKAAPHFSPMR